MSWTAPGFLDEFATRLEARGGLAGVNVYRAPVDRLEAQDNIVFVRVSGDQDWAAIGNQPRDDNYTVESSILVMRTGAGEVVAKEARDRTRVLLAEVVDDVQSLMSGGATSTFATAIGANQLMKLNVRRIDLTQGASSEERWAQVDFDIEVSARIS